MTNQNHPVRGLVKGVAILAGILVTAAVVAPWVARIAPFRYDRVLSRCVLVVLLVVLIGVVRRSPPGWIDRYGLRWRPGHGRLLVACVLLGLGILLLYAGTEVALGRFSVGWYSEWEKVPKRVVEYPIAAALIATIEETLFRGWLFQAWTAVSPPLGWIGSNLVYAAVHFLKARDVPIADPPGIVDSFRLYAAMFRPMTRWDTFIPGLIGLWIFGTALTVSFVRTKSLYAPIGVHAGAVLFLKCDGWFLREVVDAPHVLWGGPHPYASGLSWVFLVLLLLLTSILPRPRPGPTDGD